MKNMLTKIVLIVMVLFTIQTYAQTVTNVEELNRLSEEFSAEWDAAQQRVDAYCKLHNVPKVIKGEGYSTAVMFDVQDGKPVYCVLDNLGAAYTTRADDLWEGGSTGLDISGEGYSQLGVWDGGNVRTTHQEFTDQGPSRVSRQDNGGSEPDHATHVSGTLVAAGVNGNAHGMAYAANLKTWNFSNDNSEMASAAAGGMELSNHSYGFPQGWVESSPGNWQWRGNSSVDPNEDYKFGFYSTDSRNWDQIAYNAPNYLIFTSAGNQRGDGPSDAGDPGVPEVNGGEDGFDCLANYSVSKNVVVVGAVDEVRDYQGPGDVSMAYFSSWGPCDDGRIKPDIVGKGLNVYSSISTSNTSYESLQGTSMSSPNVCGSSALLQVHYQDLNGDPMRAATLKGIILHTADEAGPDTGPDYMFGWGLMNTRRAAFQISDGQGQNSVDERILDGGDVYINEVTVPEGTPELRVTICWTDPPGLPLSPQLNPRDPRLVNDLDLRVVKSGNNTYYPYSLDPEIPSAAATTTAKNNVDNVEMIVISDPEPGNYTIFVDHDGSLTGGEQAYSLIITGIDEYTVVPECTIGMVTPENGTEDILLNEWLEWEPANFANSYDIYFGTDGGGTETPTNVYNGENFLTNGFSVYMEPNTTYYLQVVPRNSQGPAVGCNQIYSFSTMETISLFPHEESFAAAVQPDMAFGWQSVDLSAGVWQSTDLIGQTDSYSMFCVNPLGYIETEFDNWLISPPFAVEIGNEYNVTSFYMGLFSNTPEALSLYWGYSPYVEDITNLVYENNEILGSWQEASGIIVPEDADIVFFGWHLNSPAGKAFLLDDVMVEDWGPVGINPGNESDIVNIYSYQSNVYINAGETWTGSSVQIFNLMGQLIYQGTYLDHMTIELQGATPGLYIVNLGDDKNMHSKKVMIN